MCTAVSFNVKRPVRSIENNSSIQKTIMKDKNLSTEDPRLVGSYEGSAL